MAEEDVQLLSKRDELWERVKRLEMEELLQEFQPDLKRRPAQAALHGDWPRAWEDYGADLLHCYNIPGLPPDNLKLESLHLKPD